MRIRLLFLALVFGAAFSLQPPEVHAAENDLTGFHSPFDFAPLEEDTAAVLEDLEGVVRLARGGSRTTLGGLSSPRALAVDETGLLLVLDGASTLVGYRRGKEAWRVKLGGDFKPPAKTVGMAARNGIVWLVDRAAPKAFLFAFDGKGLGSVDLKAWARSPFSVALGASGEAYVSDPMGPAIISLSPSGTYQGTFRLGGTGITRPTGVAVDASGRVWVSDGVTGVIAGFNAKGEPFSTGSSAKRPRFQDPLRIASGRGFLWILEGKPGRIKRLQEEP